MASPSLLFFFFCQSNCRCNRGLLLSTFLIKHDMSKILTLWKSPPVHGMLHPAEKFHQPLILMISRIVVGWIRGHAGYWKLDGKLSASDQLLDFLITIDWCIRNSLCDWMFQCVTSHYYKRLRLPKRRPLDICRDTLRHFQQTLWQPKPAIFFIRSQTMSASERGDQQVF